MIILSGDGYRLELESGVAELVLTDGDGGNRLGLALARSLRSAIERAVSESRVLLVRSEGANFCVGGDIDEFGERHGRPERIVAVVDAVHDVVRAIRALPIPVLSAVHGWCAGGGIGLGLSADVVVAGTGARFRPAYARLALAPDCGTSWHLANAFGEHRAQLAFLISGQDFDAPTAYEVGLVSEVVDDERLLERSRELAREICAGPADSLRLIRDAVRSARPGFEAHLDRERAAMVAAAASADSVEAIDSIRERRDPVYVR